MHSENNFSGLCGKYILKRSIFIFLILILLFQIYIYIRIYWLTSCVIPTYSMSPTLYRGDYICVSQQIPGRRILTDSENGNRLIVHRKKGIHSIKRNDVVVFNFPYSESKRHMKLSMKTFYCKRCVAIPGSTHRWQWKNKKHSIYLPQKGDVIMIDSINYKQYHKCIEYETGQNLKLEGGSVYLNDSIVNEYRFLHDYYFMQGDHTSDSYDSRFWGLLPDDFILGVGQFIWFSKDVKTDKIRWERIFKKL